MSNIPLMDLLFPAARQRVLALLLLQPQAAFHLRELARLTGSHAGTLAREVDKLAQAGLLLRSEQGNQVRYQAHTSHPLFVELAAMFRKTHGVVPARPRTSSMPCCSSGTTWAPMCGCMPSWARSSTTATRPSRSASSSSSG